MHESEHLGEKQQITIRVDKIAVSYFKTLSKKNGLLSYQNLINIYLIDCAKKERELNLNWE